MAMNSYYLTTRAKSPASHMVFTVDTADRLRDYLFFKKATSKDFFENLKG